MSTLITVPLVFLSSMVWFIKFLFLGGWLLARWAAYLTWPLWATVIGLGAITGLM